MINVTLGSENCKKIDQWLCDEFAYHDAPCREEKFSYE